MPSVASLLVTPQPVRALSGGDACFAYERPSTSLVDLEIVRKIVEREGCIEALQHLVGAARHSSAAAATDGRRLEGDAGYCYTGPQSLSASRRPLSAPAGVSPLVAPLVLQSVLDQLRVVGVQIVEMIAEWRRRTRGGAQTFQWRGLNYLLKMTADLDFLASCAAASSVETLRALPLSRNPLLSALPLDHPLLVREARRQSVPPEVAAQLQRLLSGGSVGGVGGVDRMRLFEASKVLAAELAAERRRQHLQRLSDTFGGDLDGEELADEAVGAETPPVTVSKSVHWSHRPVGFAARGGGLAVSSSAPKLAKAEDELEAARELLAQAEHELGALREQLATRQRQLRDADEGLAPPLAPERRRRLQTRIGGLVNDLKFRSGDVFQRRNELRRREKARDRKDPQQRRFPRQEAVISGSPSTPPDDLSGQTRRAPPLSLAGLDDAELLEQALRRDELRRHELVDRFARLRATATTAARQRARSAPAGVRRAIRSTTGSSNNSGRSRRNADARGSEATDAEFEPLPVRRMTADDVQRFVDALGLGLAPLPDGSTGGSTIASRLTLGALLKAQGIDGALLAAATDRDLEELGVALRLHRVRILDAVRAAS